MTLCVACSTCRYIYYVVGLVFGFEHLVLVVAVWLQWVIKPVPKWVRLAIAGRDYLNKQRMAVAQAQRYYRYVVQTGLCHNYTT